jgi:hypothetical protein
VTYVESTNPAPDINPAKFWDSRSGTAKVTAVNGSNATVQLINVVMEAGSGPGNQDSVGVFTFNGSATLTNVDACTTP